MLNADIELVLSRAVKDIALDQIQRMGSCPMYYDAVKSAFGCFPLDPPGNLEVGDYVRITWGGKVHQRGSLAKLLGIEIDVDEHVSDIEYMSSAVTKAEVGGTVPMTAEARISFSSTPGLYLKGSRRVRRARNLDTVFGALSKAKVDWSFLNRIVVETHSVESAEIYCSGGRAADIKAKYGANGIPVSIDASTALEHQQLLHMPNVTGTIAFSPVWLLFGYALGASAGGGKGYDYGMMDVDNPEDYEPEGADLE